MAIAEPPVLTAARPVHAPIPATPRRLEYLDSLKVLLTILVIVHHAGQPYGPTGGRWPIFDTERAAILGPFFAVNAGAYLDPAVTARVLAAYQQAAPVAAAAELEELTPRELDVLRLIGPGLSNDEIAQQLVIGEGTVKTHVGRIFDKLGVRDRAAAIVFAFDHGVVHAARALGG
jgi:DNA-binding CsgD family transcriptional regulator